MSCTHRAGLLIVGVALLAGLTFLQPGRGQPVPASAPANPPAPRAAEPAPAAPAKPAADPDRGPGGEALMLPTDRQVKRRLEAAADYLKAESWGDAVRLLQLVLDGREDVFIPVRRAGKPAAQWVSARAEALRLFGTLPPAALEFYQVQYGGQARARHMAWRRLLPIRARPPQASSGARKQSAAKPKLCSRRSAATAPNGPIQFAASRPLALFTLGSPEL